MSTHQMRSTVVTTLAAGALAAGAFATGALAAPTAASAAAISTGSKCVVNADASIFKSPVVSVAGAGFSPGADVEISGSDGFSGNVSSVASNGTFVTKVEGDLIADGKPATRRITLTATESYPVAVRASTSTLIANLAFSAGEAKVSRKDGRYVLAKKVTWRFSGFSRGKHIYVHYLHHRRPVARATFGRARGACGTLTERARLYPGGSARYSSYDFQVDDSPHYSKRSVPRLGGKLTFTAG